jgi:Dolichyl-phosphate-mannose-protein mannosyltransferase
MTIKNSKYYFFNVIIFLILFLKIYASCSTGLFEDEAIYWNWSQTIDASYSFTTVAFIRLFIYLFGSSSELIVRLPALLSNLVLIYFIFKTGRLFGATKEIIYLTIITFLSIPFVSIYTGFISPDTFLLTFCVVSVYYLLKSIKYNSTTDWVLSGIFTGLMILSKFTAVIFLIAIIAAVVLIYRRFTKNLMYLITAALVTASPLLIWNILNEPVWFKYYLLTNADKINSGFFELLILFLLSQVSVLMPFGFILIIVLSIVMLRKKNISPELLFLKYISSFLLICFLIFAFSGKIKGNWFFIIYIPVLLMMLSCELRKPTKLIVCAVVVFNFVLLAVINLSSKNIEFISQNNFSRLINKSFSYYWPDHKNNMHNDDNWTDRIIKMKNWKETVNAVESNINQSGIKYDFIACDDFNLCSLLEYYFNRKDDIYLIGDLRFRYINSAEFSKALRGKDALVITYASSGVDMKNKFEYTENLNKIKFNMSEKISKEFKLILGKSFLPGLTSK